MSASMSVEMQGDSAWDYLVPWVLEVVGTLLSNVDDLRSARLVCRHWREYLTARLAASCKGQLPLVILHPNPQQFQHTLNAVERCLPRMHSCKVLLSSRLRKEVADKEVGMLTQLVNLEYLELNAELLPTTPLLGSLPSFPPPSISRLTSLTRLALYHSCSSLPFQSLSPVAALSALRQLDISSGTVLSGQQLAALTALQQLRALSLPLPRMDDVAKLVEPLQQLPSLQDLHVARCNMPATHLPPLLGALRTLTHLECTLDLAQHFADQMVAALPPGGLLPPEGMHRPQEGAPGSPALSLTVYDFAVEALRALSPNLSHLRVRMTPMTTTNTDLLDALLQALPTLRLVSLSGRPKNWAGNPPTSPPNCVGQLLSSMAYIDDLELKQQQQDADDASSCALSSLTRLALTGTWHESWAAAARLHRFSDLRVLRLSTQGDYRYACLPCPSPMDITALPSSLTSLDLTGVRLVMPCACDSQGSAAPAGDDQPSNAAASSSGSRTCLPDGAPSHSGITNPFAVTSLCGPTPAAVPWGGLPNLEVCHLARCELKAGLPALMGGGLPVLLHGMPALLRLGFDLELVVAGGEELSQLQGCCKWLTALELAQGGGGLERDGDAEKLLAMLAWVQGLRSLRKLTVPLRQPSAALERGVLQAVPQLSLLHLLEGGRFIDEAAMEAALQKLPLADATKFPRWRSTQHA